MQSAEQNNPPKISRINTSSSYDYEKKGAREQSKDWIRINLLIIREIFNLIKNKQLKNPMFYNFIYTGGTSANAEINYNTLVVNGQGNTKIFSEKLIEYGISPEYFDNQLIIADDSVINSFQLFCKDSSIYPITKCREILKYKIFTIKNTDGTFIIDCIQNIIDDIIQTPTEKNESVYILTDKISDKKPTSHLTQSQVFSYYKNTICNYPQDSIMDEDIIDMPQGKVALKKILHHTDSEKISTTLLIIRETYRLLAQQENIANYMDEFYSYLEIPENEYQNMIDNGTVKTRHLLNKLEPFKFPSTLFRSDNPSDIDVEKEIMDACLDYQIKQITIEDFQAILKLHLYYKISTRNLGLVIATYALINEIGYSIPSYFDSLTDEEKNLYLWLQLLSEQ